MPNSKTVVLIAYMTFMFLAAAFAGLSYPA